ncbi:MAG TPA: hypothetical protein VE891_12020 [Allosphingosinicella sp.]|nr:hypothetical protein [Allosphingosinicella sp.]
MIGSGEMKIQLGEFDRAPFAIFAVGMKARDRRLAMKVVSERQEEFLARWEEVHMSA